MRKNLEYLFAPRSLAIVGASAREGSVGRALLSNALLGGFTGVVYPVNRNARSVLGVKAYPSVLDIPDDVDLAAFAVPAVTVPAVLAECGQKGVKAVVVITAGFKEMGTSGASLERGIRDRARQWNMPLVGPNCLGLINTNPAVRLNASFARLMPRPGNIAFISQSGAVGAAALEYCDSNQIGLSQFASVGNKADVNENDLLAFFKDDPDTDVILLYLEDLSAPAEFLRVAREITGHPEHPKPILAIKSGRTSEGAKAASSHTGALAGSDEVFNAFFAQARILRVDSLYELFENAQALAGQPLPRGPRVAILTNAGGIGIMATDACISNGLKLAAISAPTREALLKVVPATASLGNPVDIIGDSDEVRYRAALEAIGKDDGIDGLIAAWTPTFMATPAKVAQVIAEVAPTLGKPVLACIQTMDDHGDIRRILAPVRIPYYRFPEDAARAMAALSRFAEMTREPLGQVVRFPDVRADAVRVLIDRARARKPAFLSEPEGHEIFAAYGLPVLPHRVVKTLEEAVEAARALGYPVVLKVVSPDILHKTEFGGVKVNLKNDAELREAFASMLAGIREKKADADVWGVLVQKMAARGTEVILGMNRDRQFGTLIMFGLGGVLVEALRDVTFRVAPVSDLAAAAMLREIKAAKVLKGFRGSPPRDTAKLAECLQRLSQLVCDFEDIAEIDINPLIVYEEGKGAAVLDARFLLKA